MKKYWQDAEGHQEKKQLFTNGLYEQLNLKGELYTISLWFMKIAYTRILNASNLIIFNSPHYEFSQRLVPILESIRNHRWGFSLKYSFELATQLVNLDIKVVVLFSFDVTWLLTDVALDTTIGIICGPTSNPNPSFPIPADNL